MRPTAIFSWLTPDDDDPNSIIRWRERLAAWGTALTLLSLYLLASMYHLVPGENFGMRLVPAARAEEIHARLEADLEAIKQDIAGLRMDISTLTTNDRARALREQAREVREVRTAILDLQLRACQSTGALRSSLLQQVNELRSDYMELTGEEFPATTCAELLGE